MFQNLFCFSLSDKALGHFWSLSNYCSRANHLHSSCRLKTEANALLLSPRLCEDVGAFVFIQQEVMAYGQRRRKSSMLLVSKCT